MPFTPIVSFLPAIRDAVDRRRAVVVTAAPGAGKTTRVPPALVDAGPVLLLQPRRVAARSIARRIAIEQGWTPGREVGWQVRFEKRFTDETRLLVATEGVLTARLQDDPLATAFRTIVVDEFHERSLHADVGLALARQAWLARDDLRLVVMSATLDAARVAAFLDDCPVIEVPGRGHPLDVTHRPGASVEAVAAELAGAHRAVLCFLPGAGEIRRAIDAFERLAEARASGARAVPLHGGLDAAEQDLALDPDTGPRVIFATNLAETTLTVPDVTAVVDGGWHKVARYDAARAIDSLDLERITRDSADQRAGRAGRTGPGVVVRLWDERDRLRPHREPEIARVDLAATLLDLAAWGGDARTFAWFEAPPAESVDRGLALLRRLGAIDAGGRPTLLGRDLRRIPAHPRLARLLLAEGGSRRAARACALLSERAFVPVPHAATDCDLLAAVERAGGLPPHVEQVAADLHRRAAGLARNGAAPGRGARETETTTETGTADHGLPRDTSEAAFRRAVLAGYPDRVAKRRESGSPRVLLATGTGAALGRESGVVTAEYLVAVEVIAGAAGSAAVRTPAAAGPSAAREARVRMATAIDRAWLHPNREEIRHEITADGAVRAWRVSRYDAIVLHERAADVDADVAAGLIAAEYLRRDPPAQDVQLIRRLRFAGHDASLPDLVRAAAAGARRLADLRLASHLPHDVARTLDRDAPGIITMPEGRRVRLEYEGDGRVVARVKIQDAFGLHETPRLGPRRVPVTFALLAPNGRPAQVTDDLQSFWTRGYAEVRKELRARYPKHRWP
ncbi:MAG: ATP-dependent helicase C-terminal domain-containing protein [Vicinamibacterales bacterium]